MEEDKAAAYYDELTRKGEGAARFKQGLGFSSGDDSVPAKESALVSSSSSFLSQFVKASIPTSTTKLEKESQLRSIQDKLTKKPDDDRSHRHSERSHRVSSKRHRSTSRERSSTGDRRKRQDRSSSRERCRDSEREKDRHRDRERNRRSRSRERYGGCDRDRDTCRDRDRDGDRARKRRSRSRSRILSPRSNRRKIEDEKRERRSVVPKVDYSRLIEGYDQMSAGERVKAKMKLQLAETVEKDTTIGTGWERFEFDKDAPLDDEEVEAADDDAALVKRMGQSFRFSAIEAKREEQIKAAHDKAMFGVPALPFSATSEDDIEAEHIKKDVDESNAATSLLSEKVLAKQQGSWRDRARKA